MPIASKVNISNPACGRISAETNPRTSRLGMNLASPVKGAQSGAFKPGGLVNTNTIIIVVAAMAVVAIVAVVAWTLLRRRQTEQLRTRFGPEYDRAVEKHHDPRIAEQKLAERAKRVEKLNIRPLDPAQRAHLAERWKTVQARFVDDPAGAVTDSNSLIKQVMEARGYPVADFEERVSDLSVDHASVVQNYREARDVAVRNGRGEATTEDLRKAVVSYRTLFDELLGVETPELAGVSHG